MKQVEMPCRFLGIIKVRKKGPKTRLVSTFLVQNHPFNRRFFGVKKEGELLEFANYAISAFVADSKEEAEQKFKMVECDLRQKFRVKLVPFRHQLDTLGVSSFTHQSD